MPRVLFISYVFPPVGGAGVQRTTKFVKYLPHWGWTSSVLTASNPSVPVLDESLLAEIPPDTLVVRTRSWEPGYAAKRAVADLGTGAKGHCGLGCAARHGIRRLANLALQPDPQILWRSGAVRAGVRLLRETPHAAIVASGPPFSSFLIGAAISRRTGVPLVLDYRDEWDLSNSYWENKRLDRMSLAIQRRMQAKVVRQAKALVATSRPSANALFAVCERAGSQARVACLFNGYDPDDFAPTTPPLTTPPLTTPHSATYRLAYVGTLWNLTTVAPLVEAVCQLSRERPDLAARLELVFAGRRTAAEDALLGRLEELPCHVDRRSYLDHHEAVALMRSSDGLCALLADLPGAGRVVPAKVFEYMASGRTIFAIAPEGELWNLLRGCPRAICVMPRDLQEFCKRLAHEIERPHGATTESYGDFDVAQYSRKQQASELARLLETMGCASTS